MDMKTRRSLFRFATLAAISASLVAGCGPATPQALVASAKEYLAKNDRSAAVVQLKTALQKDPDNAEARFLLGKALLETGDVVSAQKELQKAGELKYPADQIAPALARAVFIASGPDKVIADFANAPTASPEARADLQTTLGQAYSNKENVDAALAAFAAAKAAVPGYPPALLGEARLKIGQGDVPAQLRSSKPRLPGRRTSWTPGSSRAIFSLHRDVPTTRSQRIEKRCRSVRRIWLPTGRSCTC
jgi:tetratricopeptide (TPR) repeat protein